ncbi:helix-turn-helix transcriptional regulator [Leminorella grimontii]|uniref:Helix-turn-helix transcriptional regulator n=1 Tax=Leminorella grimontii TaxID=82981 RepID=A0AAV5MVW7_9GAMM|nr:response regulator transcription factor [Leminorella grimontii]KFC95451.1 two-component response regulator [Leminorella grimontii ATCC 33999 = DSM 5078]GKX53981.1 helix-turn-helix transcriptional regulator [Leminorella grimontii]GKX60268.1 helix-turn-helix transcriptional regulator [Leminorella grimontii]VFS60407.1 Putative HTH-type transcriptional regulator yhjB [Leminorella grimontii]
MNILIIDTLPIYVHGLKSGLVKMLPEAKIVNTSNIDSFWLALNEGDISIILLDGEMEHICCVDLLDEIFIKYPEVHVIVSLRKVKKSLVRQYLRHRAAAVICKDQPLEAVVQVLRAAETGLVCLPDSSVLDDDRCRSVETLSERQREILSLLADGQSNKQISRCLNISAGTVKAHLESIFRRLNVNNRTQAAMMFVEEE